jgi:[protein-PII] uridylyltransferase
MDEHESPFKQRRQQLIDDSDLKGIDFCHTWSDEIDKEIQLLFFQLSDRDADKLAIIAVGSYGRRELCPFSDIDLTIVYDKKKNIKEISDKLLYPLWDLGIKVDHSVRTIKEANRAIQTDLKVAMGLLDARLVVGHNEFSAKLREMAIDGWKKMQSSFIPELVQLSNEREFKFGDLAYILEPNLKESHGGLRDLNVIDCFNLAFNPDSQSDEELLSAKSILLKTRVELHRNLNRYSDKFALQEQDKVAKSLGYSDADKLMKELSLAGESVSVALNDIQFRIIKSAIYKTSLSTNLLPELSAIDNRFTIKDGYIDFMGEYDLDDQSVPFILSILASLNQLRVDPDLLKQISSRYKESFPLDTKVKDQLLKLLSLGDAGLDSILNLEYYGILLKTLPYWTEIKNKPQRNAYHRYTVNRHLIQTALNAAKLVRQVARPDLLIFGSLFHDIGKGFSGDHTEIGIELMTDIGTKLGLESEDINILKDMIKFHLLLPDLATRRDIEDPATIQSVVDALNSEQLLQLLVALTEADSLATGPAAWGTWKQQLVYELAARAKHQMAGKIYPLPATEEIAAKYVELVNAKSEIQVLTDNDDLIVIGNNRSGLFATICGVLSLNNLEILKANAITASDSRIVDIFKVQSIFDRPINPDQIQEQITAYIANANELESKLKEKEASSKTPKNKLTALDIKPSIILDNSASTTSTVIEVRSTDRIGLLFKIANIISRHYFDIKSALISTIGLEAIDVFYITDTEGNKIEDIAIVDILTKELEVAI